MRVLMIDDDPMVMKYYVMALQKQGTEVTLCSTNEEALDALQSKVPFDIIVEDIMRPPGEVLDAESVEHGLLTGVVFFERYVRRLRPSTPHVFLTNHSGDDLRKRYSAPPASFFFSKIDLAPFEFADMLRAIVREGVAILYTQGDIPPASYPAVTSLRDEVKRYFKKHPEKMHSLSPRAFEELVADILHDLGLDVELTKATRDGGVDIYAYLKHEVGAFLMLVECKKWASDRPVGIDIVQRIYGIQQTQHANKALIVTTSYFTPPAKSEAARHNGLIDLKDFEALKQWLSRYS